MSSDPADRCPSGLVCVDDFCRVEGETRACVDVLCGNDRIDDGEQCEDGNDDDGDACVRCQNARCGDGFVQAGVEACDDGNADNFDGCVNCQWARCGDGFVRAGVEECENPGFPGCTGACLACIPEPSGGGAFTTSTDGHCYKRSAGTMNQATAKASCEMMKGHLVTITDETQRTMLSMNLIGSTSWIGLYEPVPMGQKEWITGEPFGAFGNIVDDGGAEQCFVQNGGAITWEDVDCANAARAACEIEPWQVEAPTAIVDNHAFRIAYGPRTWESAQMFCASMGSGHLATIGAERTQTFLAELAHLDVWIGASDNEGVFTWVTGEPFDYTNWANGGPGPENCAYMTGLSGQWRTADCAELKPFICEID